MLNKVLIIVVSLGMLFLCCFLPFVITSATEGESISYVIKPLGGRAVYTDLGMAELEGERMRLMTFSTDVIGFKDTEKVYSYPDNLLPRRVERDVSWWFGKEHIIEEYDQKNFTVTIRKFKNNKKVDEQVLQGDGPIYNVILLPFYPRIISNLDIGWSFTFRLPQKFEAKLISIDEIKINDVKRNAYHFTSDPDKFEIWVSKDNVRLPLKIKGKGGFNYSLLMKEYHSKSEK